LIQKEFMDWHAGCSRNRTTLDKLVLTSRIVSSSMSTGVFMSHSFKVRSLLATLTLALGSAALLAPIAATAGEGQSQGHGIKCYWVLVSQPDGSQVYQQVCRKGI
jgi:hypothetical protein